MEREICISIEIDFDETLGSEFLDAETWREVELSIAAEYEELGIGEVQGYESTAAASSPPLTRPARIGTPR